MKTKIKYLVVPLISLFLFSSLCFAKEPEEIWRELDQLSGEKRQSFLLSKARKEGKVVWYTNLRISLFSALRNDFNKTYPKVKLEFWRASGDRVANRVMTEARAGLLDADIISVSNEFLPILIKADLVGRYRSPERKFYSETFKDKAGYWTSNHFVVAVIAYNTTLVPKSKAPKQYEDFLKPEWKGNFAMDVNPDRALMGWLKIWGNERTEIFLQALVKNDVALRRGHTLMTQLLCAGEFSAAIELYAYRVSDLKRKGCPVQMVFPNPTPGALAPTIVAKRSLRPYGAALLLDYILSMRAQRILLNNGSLSGRRGIGSKYSEMDVEKRGVRLLLLGPDDSKILGKKYLELRERFLLNRY